MIMREMGDVNILCKTLSKINLNPLKRFFLVMIFMMFYIEQLQAASLLAEYFKNESVGNHKYAQKALNDWKPKNFEEESYKKYFLALKINQAETFWQLYQDLSKNKKLLKLQHESIRNIIELDLLSDRNTVKDFKKFEKAAKLMLGQMKGQPEGKRYELLYLKWILKNKNTKELCETERSRWLSQSNLDLIDILQGLETCSMTYDDFIYRLRTLIFFGEEKKAQSEIVDFVAIKKLSEWEKAYLQAIYFSNNGDPTAAYDTLIPFESDVKKNEDYYMNLFYISQRAGELAQAEKIIDNIIKAVTASAEKNKAKKDEVIFQKALFYYQTKRYIEANKILAELIKSHPSHRKKNKSKEYDHLTWLRAWCHYLAKEYEQARDFLIENKKWTHDKARNLYWLAQAEWALDNRVTALSGYRQLALPVLYGKYFSYYNYLAWLRLDVYRNYFDSELIKSFKVQIRNIKSGRSLYALPDFSMNPNELIEEYESYLEDVGEEASKDSSATDEGNTTRDNPEEEGLEEEETKGIQVATPTELKNEISWTDDLIKWGYRDLAKWHLFEVEKSLLKKSAAEPLVEYYSANQYYYRALSLANSISSPAGKNLNKKEDPILWNSLFPKAYRTYVEKEAKKRKIHPYLIWSIMKAETQYKDDAISPVGAVGLMQFMPYTSQKVAVLLKEKHKISLMFEPESAIKYGAMYLKKLSDELNGQLPLVAAAYNGGPHRVKLWLKNFKERDGSNMEYDAFIEHIPFRETRTYVKRVLSYNLIYQKLYDDKLDAKATRWIIEKIPFKLQEPIVLKEEWPFDKKK